MHSRSYFAVLFIFASLFNSQFEDVSGQVIVFGNGDHAGSQPDCNCILMSECISLFTTNKRVSQRQINEIRRRRCGFRENILLVCCPTAAVTTQGFTTLSIPTTSSIPSTSPTPTTSSIPTTYFPSVTSPPSHPTKLPLKCGQPTTIDRIIGGVEAALGAHPWMVALGFRSRRIGSRQQNIQYRCGGSLITEQHVLSAAHCVHPDRIGLEELVALNIGDWNTQTDPDCTVDGFGRRECAPPVQVRAPAVITWHPQYNTNLRHINDIAVIRLDRPVIFTFYVRPICIPDSFTNNGAGYATPVATGWGETELSSSSDTLLEVKLSFVDFATCNESYAGRLSEHQLCTGGEEGKDTCLGDSGGPLVAGTTVGPPFHLVGLTSFGKSSCGRAGNFGVYTVVADFRDWIEETLKL